VGNGDDESDGCGVCLKYEYAWEREEGLCLLVDG